MLLEFPNPKDPQDAQVARISLDDPEQFARNARDWAVRYAGAPADQPFDPARYQQKQGGHSPPQDPLYQYQGYNEHLVDRFTSMGFDVPAVVDAFNRAGLPRHGGRDYEPEEAYIGDVTAHLLGES